MNDPRHPQSAPHPHHASTAPQAPRPQLNPGARPGVAPMPVQPIRPNESDLDPIELVEDELQEVTSSRPSAPPAKPKIVAFGNESQRREHQWKRKTFTSGQGAVRVKSFHGKYSDQGLEHLDDVINEWLDNHPDVEVKFVTSTVNVFEGKIREPALVLNLWY